MRRAAQLCGMAAAMAIGAGLAGPATSFAQRTFEKPTADTGPIDVRPIGPIDVRQVEPIEARLVPPSTVGAFQAGTWSFTLEGQPGVAIAAPGFLERGEIFRFWWSEQAGEAYRVLELRDDGWVRAELVDSGARRWLNPSLAISIERVGR